MVEQFRKVTYSTYGLHGAHHYACFHLSSDVFLKVRKARLELLTDRSHLERASNLIRRGVSSVFPKPLATMNNKHLQRFDERKARTYGFLVDANNLHGGIMHKHSLPLTYFDIVDVELSTSLKTANDSEIGLVLEVTWTILVPSTICRKTLQWFQRPRKLIAECCASIRCVYWIKQAMNVVHTKACTEMIRERKFYRSVYYPEAQRGSLSQS